MILQFEDLQNEAEITLVVSNGEIRITNNKNQGAICVSTIPAGAQINLIPFAFRRRAPKEMPFAAISYMADWPNLIDVDNQGRVTHHQPRTTSLPPPYSPQPPQFDQLVKYVCKVCYWYTKTFDVIEKCPRCTSIEVFCTLEDDP